LRTGSIATSVVFNAMTITAPIPVTTWIVAIASALIIQNAMSIPAPVSILTIPFITRPNAIRVAVISCAGLLATLNAACSINAMSTWGAFYTAIATMIIIGGKIRARPVAVAVVVADAFTLIAVLVVTAAGAMDALAILAGVGSAILTVIAAFTTCSAILRIGSQVGGMDALTILAGICGAVLTVIAAHATCSAILRIGLQVGCMDALAIFTSVCCAVLTVIAAYATLSTIFWIGLKVWIMDALAALT
jgi:hypothetical protein